MPYLLDTNVLSELRKGRRCHPKVAKWAQITAHDRHFISVLSLGEIRKGIELLRRKSREQCAPFEKWLRLLESEYAENILQIDEAIADQWGSLMAEWTLPVIDGLIAATALAYRLKVVTRNTGDFQGTGVDLVNPFGQV